MKATFGVEVEVALSRPPQRDATVFCVVALDVEHPLERLKNEARLIACQMASTHPRVVMPVAATVVAVDIETEGGTEW